MKITRYNWISILSLIGIAISSYLIYAHHSLSNKAKCLVGSSCGMIYNSTYSEIFGLPVALIGVLGFLMIFSLSLLKKMKLIFLLSIFSLIFIIYFVLIELLVFGELCYLCTVAHIAGLLIFMLSYNKRYTMYKIIRPVFFKFDAERVHDIFILLGKTIGSTPLSYFIKKFCNYRHPSLKIDIGGVGFSNPIGLAAGFDKNALLMKIMPALGFGFEEVGSVTDEGSSGNSKPRLWRLPKDKSLVVNYGLSNDGADIIKNRINKKFDIPIWVSVARTNKPMTESESISDYVKCFKKLHKYGSCTVINVSCPNVSDSQPFCYPNKLPKLIKEINKCKFTKPVFLKLKPDMSKKDIDGALKVIAKYKWVTGFILTNLSKSRANLRSNRTDLARVGDGGISGLAMQKKSDDMIKYIYKKTKGKYILVGVGGVFTAEDAYRKIRNGASLIQLITGLVYEGPCVVKNINKGLVKLLRRDGFKNISEAVGVDVKF